MANTTHVYGFTKAVAMSLYTPAEMMMSKHTTSAARERYHCHCVSAQEDEVKSDLLPEVLL